MDPISTDPTSRALTELARATLRSDDRDGYTVPSPRLYPYQWMWDSGFIALGWRTFDEARAWRELRLLFDAQWDDGMVPHIVFHRTDPGYFPGPEVWQGRGPVPGSGITQPPVLASIVRRLLERAKDWRAAEREAHALYPSLREYHRWLVRARDPHGTGLVAILHPWESGLDNSPSWDAALARAPRVPLPAARRDTAHVAAEQRPHAEQYERYLGLVVLFRDLGYDPDALFRASPFRVVSVSFNAILHRANRDLLSLARRFGPADATEIEAWLARSGPALESLWDEEQEFYYSRDAIDGAAIGVRTFEGFMPLYAGTPSTLRADVLAATAERWGNRVRYLLPSTDPADPTFEPRRYWRGPVWLNVNWMLARGFQAHGHAALGARLRADGLELARRTGMWEYYDPTTGEGLGGSTFAWTAATVLDWLDDPDGSGSSGGDHAGDDTSRDDAPDNGS